MVCVCASCLDSRPPRPSFTSSSSSFASPFTLSSSPPAPNDKVRDNVDRAALSIPSALLCSLCCSGSIPLRDRHRPSSRTRADLATKQATQPIPTCPSATTAASAVSCHPLFPPTSASHTTSSSPPYHYCSRRCCGTRRPRLISVLFPVTPTGGLACISLVRRFVLLATARSRPARHFTLRSHKTERTWRSGASPRNVAHHVVSLTPPHLASESHPSAPRGAASLSLSC